MKHSFRSALQLPSQMLPTDAFFWYAEAATPQLRPFAAVLFTLDRAPDPTGFRNSILRLIAIVPRFRQRVVDPQLPLRLPHWEDVDDLDLNYHLREIILPGSPTERALLQFAARILSAPLDHRRPLWEAYLIRGLQGGRAAFFLKLHHSIMDGIGGAALFNAVSQAKRSDTVPAPPEARRPKEAAAEGGALIRATEERLRRTVGVLDAAVRAGFRLATHPAETATGLTHRVSSLGGLLGEFQRTAGPSPLSESGAGIGRRLAAACLPRASMQRVEKQLSVPLNDLFLTVVAGAMGRYHRQRGVQVEQLRCMVPMSVRRDDERYTLGNHLTVFRVDLPLGTRDPLERLQHIHHQTSTAKSGRDSNAYQAFMPMVSLIPGALFRTLAQSLNGRIQLICSNVPGPPARRYIGGAKIDGVYPFAPVMLGIPVSIALVSYGKTFCIGIDADATAVPDAEPIREYLSEAAMELEACASRAH